jgi:hypothetical protein
MSMDEPGRGRAVENPYSLFQGLDGAETLSEGKRKVQDQGGGGDSVCVNLTEKGASHHEIEIGDFVSVKTYEEGILIQPPEEENEESEDE